MYKYLVSHLSEKRAKVQAWLKWCRDKCEHPQETAPEAVGDGRCRGEAGINPGRRTFAPLPFITGHTLQFMSGDASPDVSVRNGSSEKPEHACLSIELAQRGINPAAYLGTTAINFTGKKFPPESAAWVSTCDELHVWHSTSVVPAQIQDQSRNSPSLFGKSHKCNSSFSVLTFL